MEPTKKKFRPFSQSSQFYRILKERTKREYNVTLDKAAKAKISRTDNTQNSLNLVQTENVEECYNERDLLLDEINSSEYESLEDQLSLIDELRLWALTHRVTITAVSDLLNILRRHGKEELPRDGRTLLKTPAVIPIIEMGSGKFWYSGVENNLLNTLSNIPSCPSKISLMINVDGMSPFNSSNHQFWPISFLIDEIRAIKPMVAAIYYGESKPPLSLYFTQFVQELLRVMQFGLNVNGQKIEVNVSCFVCDTQARSFIKGTPACNAENGSCIKCTVVGEWDSKGRHMSYPRIHSPLRTDQSFRNKTDDDHHKETTPLIQLPIDMVEDFVIADELHLFHLGVMRRCLYGWREGSYNFRTKLSKNQADLISAMLENCNNSKPMDIERAIRGLKSLKFWKGSEYRVFLHYLGPVVLKDFLPREIYEHFLLLSCAVSILSCKTYLKFIDIADQLLETYIEMFIEIYGVDSISSNIHNLCHVVADVKKFGPLPQISAYPFENSLGHLKTLVRHGNLPLSQIAKRVIEISRLNNSQPFNDNSVYVKKKKHDEHHENPLCKHTYEQVNLAGKSFILCTDNKNQFFMTKN